MNPLRVLILEDELLTANDIKDNLIKAGYQVSGIARTLEKSLELFKTMSPDVILADINLNGPVDGITVVHTLLKHKRVPIIYLTAYSEQEIFKRAKQTNPAAYLVKPFRMSELALQIDLAIHSFYLQDVASVAHLIDHFLLPVGRTYLRVSTDEILYIGADRSYSEFFLTENGYERIKPQQKVVLSVNLGHFAKQTLPAHFYQLSRSAIVNLHYIDAIESDEAVIRQHRLAIPEGKRKALMERFNLIASK